MADPTDDNNETKGGEAPELEIEIEDDTPPEDRNREPMPEEVIKELENDELDEYSDAVKQRLKQAKKVYHDERRAKQKEAREKQEAINFAQRMMEENRALQSRYAQGEQAYLQQQRDLAASRESAAEREYREALDSGDTEKQVAAQKALSAAQFQLNSLGDARPATPPEGAAPQVPLQPQAQPVSIPPQQSQPPTVDPKTQAWQESNEWFGTDPEMTSAALGLHQKLVQDHGPEFVQTDDYFTAVDTTMRRRFPEYFEGHETEGAGGKKPAKTPKAPVVAPATRSRAPRKVRLTESQVAIAKRLGLTNEQYALETLKLEG